MGASPFFWMDDLSSVSQYKGGGYADLRRYSIVDQKGEIQMNHPGQTARGIRLSKGFSQKEIYTGIVSKSYAISFEQGNTMLNYQDLTLVLERLCVTLQEFEFIRAGYRNPESVSLWRSFANAANSKQQERLEELYRLHKNDKSDFNKVIAYLSRAILYSFSSGTSHPSTPCTTDEQRFLTNYLLKKESWMLEEINLFSSYYYLFDSDTQRLFIRSCYESLRRYEEYSHYEERMYNLLTNYIADCYRRHRREDGDHWLLKLRALPKNKAYLHQLIHAKLCEALRLAAHGHAGEGRAIAAESAGIFRSLGFAAEAEETLRDFESILMSYQKAAK
jgi:Rgg/GadR/MutR family transcriptional activator